MPVTVRRARHAHRRCAVVRRGGFRCPRPDRPRTGHTGPRRAGTRAAAPIRYRELVSQRAGANGSQPCARCRLADSSRAGVHPQSPRRGATVRNTITALAAAFVLAVAGCGGDTTGEESVASAPTASPTPKTAPVEDWAALLRPHVREWGDLLKQKVEICLDSDTVDMCDDVYRSL